MNAKSRNALKVADEVWIAMALLHREEPKREDFSVSEIIARARRENIIGELRPGVQVHAYLHCVANLPPNPGRYRMLYATGKNTRRLFRESDDFHPQRVSGKITPRKENIPAQYYSLLDGTRTNSLASGRVLKKAIPSSNCAGLARRFGWERRRTDT